MPHGRRSERINQRDLEVLEFISRFGLVTQAAVATWAASARSVSYARERRLIAAGLITRSDFGTNLQLLAPTAVGLHACGRPDLRPPQPSHATIHHEVTAARLAAMLERRGQRLLSEREIGAFERVEGERLLSASLAGGRFHRADLVRLAADGTPADAIEIELTSKGAARLDAILRAWRWVVAERRLERVVYHCAARTRPQVERAIERTQTAAVISSVGLEL